ncbi:sensor histidine kinase [Pseudonocardia halophobica]|uniref:anti-sigma factor RsbA family regulatory protein n=1 Tax=Pseudonocardia halophobica TaxID=29401 RepID=UPI00055BEDE5
MPTTSGAEDGGRFRHPALFYRGLDEYLAGTLSFIAEGLRAGEPVAVAVPGPKLGPLRAALGESAGRVRLIDMTHAGRNPGRILPEVLFAFADHHVGADRVRIIGEPIWPGRSEVEYPACVQHEALINQAFAGRPVDILCPYDVNGLPERVVADAERTHPTVIGPAGHRPSGQYQPHHVLAEYNEVLPEPPRRPSTVQVDIRTLSQARALAVAEAQRAGLTPDRVADFKLAINELVTNSIEHATGECALRVWIDDAHLVGEVQDAGRIGDPLVGRRPARPGQVGGRGLLLVNHVTDLVRVHATGRGTVIRIHFRR